MNNDIVKTVKVGRKLFSLLSMLTHIRNRSDTTKKLMLYSFS